jgi:hypothetical protein
MLFAGAASLAPPRRDFVVRSVVASAALRLIEHQLDIRSVKIDLSLLWEA